MAMAAGNHGMMFRVNGAALYARGATAAPRSPDYTILENPPKPSITILENHHPRESIKTVLNPLNPGESRCAAHLDDTYKRVLTNDSCSRRREHDPDG